jgi:hypothetical protein
MTMSRLEGHLIEDIRLRERLLRDGIIAPKEVEKQVKALEDLSGEFVEVPAYEVGNDPVVAASSDAPTFEAASAESAGVDAVTDPTATS